MLCALLAAVRRFFSRRRARRLLAQRLPRGVSEARLALPAPAREPPPGEYWTLPLVGHRPSRLLRLSALPPPPAHLDVVQPRKLRLDDDLRLPPEIDPPAVPSAPERPLPVRPRTPLARAPLHRLKPRNFRLDLQATAHGGIVPETGDPSYRWISPEFRRRYLELPWMARDRIRFLGPMHAEWFLMWWDQTMVESLGPGEPEPWERPEEVDWAMDVCKEQMLIRRDVKKDENPPEKQEFYQIEVGVPIQAHERKPLRELVPAKEWVPRAEPLPLPTVPPMAREAYLQWRTLVDALEER